MNENKKISQLLRETAVLLEMNDVPFRPQAYEKAAEEIEALGEPVVSVYRGGGTKALEEIPGVGKAIAEHIEEFIKTGKIKTYLRLKKDFPVNLKELLAVEGIGPKTIKELYLKLKIKNIADLERAAKAGKIRKLADFGEKSEKNILDGIAFLKRSSGRFLLGEILPSAREIEARLKKLKQVKKISIAGSLRRRKETIGDVDFLIVSSDPEPVMDFFVSMPETERVWSRGRTKSSIRFQGGFDIDLRVVPEKAYGAALQYFTGSKEHNIATRKIAIEKGLRLNEYGIFRGKKMMVCRNEEDVYKILNIACPPAEMREDQGEIELAVKHELPKIIGLKDIKGDLHVHSNWDGGENSIEELANEAVKRGYEYLGISDHTQFLRIENGLTEKQLLKQNQTIKKLNAKFSILDPKFRILHGCETNILSDGRTDISDNVLAKLDYVIAGVHSAMRMPEKKMTERIIRAMNNRNIDIISHPTGRILKRRDEFEIDFEKILKNAKMTGTILEINSSPDRLDLNDKNIRKAAKAGVKMIINTDSHEKSQLGLVEYGVFQARRGWAQKKDIVNTWPIERIVKAFKMQRSIRAAYRQQAGKTVRDRTETRRKMLRVVIFAASGLPFYLPFFRVK